MHLIKKIDKQKSLIEETYWNLQMAEHEESNLAEIKKLKFLGIKDVTEMKQSIEVKL